MKQIAILTLGILMSFINLNGQTNQYVPDVKKIIIDAGHGGSDGGAKGTISNEATITLQVARKLAEAIKTKFPHITVLETRPNTEFPGGTTSVHSANRWRADFANQSGADLFISLHCNAAGSRPGGWYEKRVIDRIPKTRKVKKGRKYVTQKYYQNVYEDVWVENKAHGTETLIWAVGKNNAKVSSIKNNEDYYNHEEIEDSTHEAGFEMPDPNDPAEKARMLIYAQNYFRKSYSLAAMVEKEFTGAGRVSRGVKQRNEKGIWVLQATGMPSILIEMGFVSNKEEEEYMVSQAGQDEIVKNIIAAITNYVTMPLQNVPVEQ